MISVRALVTLYICMLWSFTVHTSMSVSWPKGIVQSSNFYLSSFCTTSGSALFRCSDTRRSSHTHRTGPSRFFLLLLHPPGTLPADIRLCENILTSHFQTPLGNPSIQTQLVLLCCIKRLYIFGRKGAIQIRYYYYYYYYYYRATRMHSAGYAVARWPSVSQSVCHMLVLSRILRVFSPSGSPTILVFPHQTGWQYSDGDHPP